MKFYYDFDNSKEWYMRHLPRMDANRSSRAHALFLIKYQRELYTVICESIVYKIFLIYRQHGLLWTSGCTRKHPLLYFPYLSSHGRLLWSRSNLRATYALRIFTEGMIVELSKNLARYRFEINFVGLSKYLCKKLKYK